MKQYLLSAIIITFLMTNVYVPDAILAQVKKSDDAALPKLPIDETTKLITYKEAVQMDGKKADLYQKGLTWFNTFYKNPTDVIRKQDPENGMIQGIARYKVYNKHKKGIDTEGGLVAYTIILYVKDGMYKYELSKFNWKQDSHYPIEKWMDKSSKLYSNQYDNYLIQTDAYAKKLIEDLKNHMGVIQPVNEK